MIRRLIKAFVVMLDAFVVMLDSFQQYRHDRLLRHNPSLRLHLNRCAAENERHEAAQQRQYELRVKARQLADTRAKARRLADTSQ